MEKKKIKVRGTGTYDPETQKFGFEPFNEGPSTQANVKSCAGGGKMWTTTGSKPSRMISLKCLASSPDAYNDLLTQFTQLTKDLKPAEPLPLPDKQRVVNEDVLQCWLDTEHTEVTFTGKIDLSRHQYNWQGEVLRLVQMVVRRLPGCEQFNKIINNIKNGGKKQ